MGSLYWLKGGILGIAYVGVIIFLKGICPAEWCFADIFLPWFLEPLVLFDLFLKDEQVLFLANHLLLTIFIFWFILGAVLGLFYGFFKKRG